MTRSSSCSASPATYSKSARRASPDADMDPAKREKALAERLRRRAIASKMSTRRRSRSPTLHRASSARSISRSHSPPSRRRLSTSPESSRSPSRSPSPHRSDRRLNRRDEEEREAQRRRRRSGRDADGYDDEEYRRVNRRPSSRRGGTKEPDDDARSYHSAQSSRRHREIRSRDTPPAEYHSRRRDPYDNRRSSSRRYDDDYDSYYRRGYYQAHPSAHVASYDYHGPVHHGYDRRPSRRRSPTPRRRSFSEEVDEYERRSVFCSQLAARMTQRDLGEFFEEKLGEDTVRDVRIVTDKVTGRSKGIGYVELMSEDLVEKAINLSGNIIYGIPILVQLTEAARNRGEGASTAMAPIRPNLPGLDPAALNKLPMPPHLVVAAGQVAPGHRNATFHPNTEARLYVGSLHFSLTDTDIKAIFEPFGEIDHVDLHREPTGKSKGFAFVQFRSPDDAERAIEHMNGFELAGRNIRVGYVNARGQEGKTRAQLTASEVTPGSGAPAQTLRAAAAASAALSSGSSATLTSAFDEGGGGGLNAQSRANLMQMLSRSDQQPTSSISSPQVEQSRPTSIPEATSKCILLKNMFNPEEETEKNWDKDLAEDVKGECQCKYGNVIACVVDKDSEYGEIYLSFADVSAASRAINGLNGRWFGGRQVSATFISESFMTARFG